MPGKGRKPTMDALDCIATKLDVREFSNRPVPTGLKREVLEAGRLTGSGMNKQHWRFILVEDRQNLKQLANDSRSGGWVQHADFAIVVLTNPSYGFHQLDAGRVVQDMQLAAWNRGVASGIFTGIDERALREHLAIPAELHVSVIAGFGYPARRISGRKKNRVPIEELASLERYGNPLAPDPVP
jgi:nitroreductase